MTKIDQRTTAKMEAVLEEVCRGLPNGGNHESRKRIAKAILQAAKKGDVTLDAMRSVARAALEELSPRKSA
jgi:hypothetical protein